MLNAVQDYAATHHLVTHLEVCLDKVPSLRRFYCTIIVIIQLLMKSPYSLQPNLVLSG